MFVYYQFSSMVVVYYGHVYVTSVVFYWF